MRDNVTLNHIKLSIFSNIDEFRAHSLASNHGDATDYGHFAYDTLYLLDSSPTSWTLHLLTSLTVTVRIDI